MEVKYFSDTDTLLLILNNKPVASTEDVSKNVLMSKERKPCDFHY